MHRLTKQCRAEHTITAHWASLRCLSRLYMASTCVQCGALQSVHQCAGGTSSQHAERVLQLCRSHQVWHEHSATTRSASGWVGGHHLAILVGHQPVL